MQFVLILLGHIVSKSYDSDLCVNLLKSKYGRKSKSRTLLRSQLLNI